MNNELGKIFMIKNVQVFDTLEPMYHSSNFLISKYNYDKPNSYIDLINKADKLGLEQLTLSPNKFIGIMKKLIEYSYRVKNIQFDPPLNNEDQEEFNREFEILLSKVNSGYGTLTSIKRMFDQLNAELHSIPRNLNFFSEHGNCYKLYNNGVIFIEDQEEISEIDGVLSSFIHEVQSR